MIIQQHTFITLAAIVTMETFDKGNLVNMMNLAQIVKIKCIYKTTVHF